MLQTLRKSGRTLVLPLPKEFIGRNALTDGSRVAVRVVGRRLIVEMPARPRYSVASLMSEMPGSLPRAEGWDELRPVDGEGDSGLVRSAGNRLLRFAASQENVGQTGADGERGCGEAHRCCKRSVRGARIYRCSQ